MVINHTEFYIEKVTCY